MTCHQHRCCRRSAASAADVAAPVDYIVLAATEANVTEGIATMLRGAGVAVERHELGLRPLRPVGALIRRTVKPAA